LPARSRAEAELDLKQIRLVAGFDALASREAAAASRGALGKNLQVPFPREG
jgi:hypothetical protein